MLICDMATMAIQKSILLIFIVFVLLVIRIEREEYLNL